MELINGSERNLKPCAPSDPNEIVTEFHRAIDGLNERATGNSLRLKLVSEILHGTKQELEYDSSGKGVDDFAAMSVPEIIRHFDNIIASQRKILTDIEGILGIITDDEKAICNKSR